ncbi:HAMP domain-containing sensor histidine kinase [Paraclostridium ghonii]|uniref:sensor histidine kinase n=1 Tax=Paraclostridium ghonii TaxID=29358 RepID=UPI00202D0074|nr:HAMP domain-containing sensor histidine kinase [Paeniclostridium ghonii]MCM0167242.1 HAMP domain-containing histidine kinase [Paeniclostridium ghonii]
MNKIFINKEVKKSTIILILLLTIFMILQVFMYKSYIENQKQDYIDIIGGMISRTVALDPELEKELIPLVTRDISEEDKEKGQIILKQYGVTGDLNRSLFPNFTNNYGILILSFVLVCLLILLNYVQNVYFFSKIRKMTLAANKILDDDYTSLINEDKEGDFAKLAVAFSNVRSIIKNNISSTQKEKQYLVELLQNISHQLKTKLATMILYNDILLNRKITEEQRIKFLQDNSIQLDNMNVMIQNILKLAKLDANTIEFCKKEESLNQTIKEVLYSLKEVANVRNVKLEINEFEQISLQQDKFWIKEAFNNIIKNCIEHTPEDGIVKAYLLNNPAYYRVIIEDSGEGIDQSDIANIFNRFYKTKTSNKKDSVGIGLSISKSIIESHNGYIDVKSKKGMGTRFIITFMKY